MRSQATERQHGAVFTARVRDEADDLLHGLLRERARCEARTRELGRPDPLKSLTGTSSLDRAIASTGAMLEHLNEILAEMETALPDPAPPTPVAPAAPPIGRTLVPSTP
ncbi:MAG: hypothetical protein HKO59_16265 [Phycisphaerales bacterium]|nr:hypothetical protein [Phycisphaerae bacterium]NNF44656.1 hypothetical protein [Phycisphaerales bacterium]NNM27506.1 hypothetical protein [Phycisphaerales bacterium]